MNREISLIIKDVVLELTKRNKTISIMESCTGGGVCNELTNVEGASKVFKFGAVTYCNEYKIRLGVCEYTIEKFGVYSKEVANEMSVAIANFACADYGVGVTGKLNYKDIKNPEGKDNIVYMSIYDKINNKFCASHVEVNSLDRKNNKEVVIKQIGVLMVNNIL